MFCLKANWLLHHCILGEEEPPTCSGGTAAMAALNVSKATMVNAAAVRPIVVGRERMLICLSQLAFPEKARGPTTHTHVAAHEPEAFQFSELCGEIVPLHAFPYGCRLVVRGGLKRRLSGQGRVKGELFAAQTEGVVDYPAVPQFAA